MTRNESALSPRALSAQREEGLLMLWAIFQSRMLATEHDLRLWLTAPQWRRFEASVRDLSTDTNPVPESALREYSRLVNIADKLFNKLFPKRAKKRSPAWHALHVQMGDCYCSAAAELSRVISTHPAVVVMLSPTPQLPRLASATRLGLSAGDMPRVRKNRSAPLAEPSGCSDQWQEAAFGFVQELMRKKYPKAAAFQDDLVLASRPSA